MCTLILTPHNRTALVALKPKCPIMDSFEAGPGYPPETGGNNALLRFQWPGNGFLVYSLVRGISAPKPQGHSLASRMARRANSHAGLPQHFRRRSGRASRERTHLRPACDALVARTTLHCRWRRFEQRAGLTLHTAPEKRTTGAAQPAHRSPLPDDRRVYRRGTAAPPATGRFWCTRHGGRRQQGWAGQHPHKTARRRPPDGRAGGSTWVNGVAAHGVASGARGGKRGHHRRTRPSENDFRALRPDSEPRQKYEQVWPSTHVDVRFFVSCSCCCPC